MLRSRQRTIPENVSTNFMKKTAIILILICLIQAGYSQKKYSIFIDHDKDFKLIDNERFIGNDSLIIKYFDNGSIKSIGNYAIDEFGKVSSLRIGKWTDFYSNGKIKSVGDYKISSYLDCGVAGLERIFYNFKTGEWIYYNQDSTIEAKGTYKIIKTKIDTRCKGGDSLIFMTITDNWDFPNSSDILEKVNKVKYLLISDEFDDGFKIDYYYDIKSKKVLIKFGNE